MSDHEVITGLIPRITDVHLGHDAAVERIRSVSGLVPVGIVPDRDSNGGGRVLWADLGSHPFREWQFSYTVQHLAEKGLIGEAFSTEFAILQDDAILANPILPSGFIYHVGRCGSTLSAKALARAPNNVVINEGGPLQKGFWEVITRNWSRPADTSPENLRAFRNLVMAMTRRRQVVQQFSFVKLNSWSTLYIRFIAAAFPEAAGLFLYRDPVEVIASVKRGTTSILLAKGQPLAGFLTGLSWQDTAAMDDTRYIATCIANYMRTALAMGDGVKLVNYLNITPTNFPRILRDGLGYDPLQAELALMLEQFRYHAKDDKDSAVFVADSAQKQRSVPVDEKAVIDAICSGLVASLNNSPNNIFAGACAS